jgi:PII-like signaling protein
MPLAAEQTLLRLYLDSADRDPHAPTVEGVLHAARRDGLAGCTVFEGIYGLHGTRLLARSPWTLVQHLPVVVEIVDTPPRVAAFVDERLAELMTDGLATVERAAVMTYRHRHTAGGSLPPIPGSQIPLSTLPDIQPRAYMRLDDNGILLRVFIGESDRAGSAPLYEAIVQHARQLGLAGATVLRGTQGFGAHSVVHKAKLLELSADLPIVVEIVDSAEKIKTLLPHLDELVKEGMITMEEVRILAYRASGAKE